jgi:uncharacterized membrane protein
MQYATKLPRRPAFNSRKKGDTPMPVRSKAEAQRRADDIACFRRELERLHEEGIVVLGASDHAAVVAHQQRLLGTLAGEFDIDTDHREKQLSLGMRITSFLGALALAASVFFLFQQFWGNFSTTVQTIILVIAPLFSLAATFLVACRETTGYFTKLLGMITLACFVLNLYMLGLIHNIAPSPNAFLIWALFTFLLAYGSDARILLGFAIISLAAFLSAKTGTWNGCYWLDFGERPENFFPAALLLFCVPLLPHHRFSGFAAIYRVFALLLFFLPTLILANWGQISYLPLTGASIEALYQLVGFFGSGLVIWLGVKTAKAELVTTGNIFFTIFLYTKFFDWWWEALPKYIFFLIIGLTAVVMLVLFKRLRAATARQNREVTP